MTKSSHRVKAQNANANSTSVVNQSQSGQHVNTIPYSTFQKIKGTEKLYQESIEASSSFNKRLLNDRKMRIPFLDNQTRVAQSNNCMLWLMEYHRQPNHMSEANEGRPYSYPTKKWYKQRRLEIAHISLRPHHFQHHHHPNYINYHNQLQQMREQHHHHHHGHHNHHHHGHHLNQSASVDANLNYLANSTSNASSSAATQSAQQTQQSTVVAMNENSNSMDVPERSQQSAANGPQETATAPVTAGSIGRSHSNDYEMQSSSNQEWANHHHPAVSRASATPTTSAAMGYIDDSFENFDSFNEPDGDSDQDDYEESGKKKKKKVTKPRRKATDASLNGEEKQFVCDICGVKYKTKPGLTYHRKTHLKNKTNGNGTPSQSGTPSGATSSNSWAHHLAKSNDGLLNPDESNTNSMFESHGGDDVNSLSNMSHTNSSAVAAVAANHDKQSAESLATKCGICMGNENEGRANLANPQAPNEKFISCSDCSKLFHPSCLNFYNPSMIAAIKKYNWQCIECKRCTHCGNSENDDKLLFCDDCDRGFHMYCLKPPLNEAPQGDWRCELCVKQLGSA